MCNGRVGIVCTNRRYGVDLIVERLYTGCGWLGWLAVTDDNDWFIVYFSGFLR